MLTCTPRAKTQPARSDSLYRDKLRDGASARHLQTFFRMRPVRKICRSRLDYERHLLVAWLRRRTRMDWTSDAAGKGSGQAGGRASGISSALHRGGWSRLRLRLADGPGPAVNRPCAVKFGCLSLFAGALLAPPALAQATRQFSSTTSGAINSGTARSTPLVRITTVATNFIIGVVDAGVLDTHSCLNDTKLTLQPRAGTSTCA